MKHIFMYGAICSLFITSDCSYARVRSTNEVTQAIGYGQSGRSNVSARVEVTHIDHHKGVLGEKISLRFNTEPMFHHVPLSPESGYQQLEDENNVMEVTLTFFLPFVTVKGSKNKEFIAQLNATKSESYSVQVDPTHTPVPGLMCTVSFNKKAVGFQVESFISIKGDPAISFTFHPRTTLKDINENHKTVLRTAHAVKPLKKKYV